MPTPKKGARLGAGPSHQKLMIANLATSLFEHGRITTTEAKARALRPVAERLITKAKKGDLHNRRQVLSTIRDKGVVHSLFEEIAPRFAERPGGYTRITKLGPRKGDNAPMAVIELVTEEYSPKAAQRGKQAAAPAAAPAGEDTATEDTATEDTATEGTATEGTATEDATGDTAAEEPSEETEAPTEESGTDEAPSSTQTGGEQTDEAAAEQDKQS